MSNPTTDEKSLVEQLRARADRWQPWIDDGLEAEVGYLPAHMRYHQELDRKAANMIEGLQRELAAVAKIGGAALKQLHDDAGGKS